MAVTAGKQTSLDTLQPKRTHSLALLATVAQLNSAILQ